MTVYALKPYHMLRATSTSAELRHFTCHMPHATCYMLHATCYMLHATCCMPHVTCDMLATCYIRVFHDALFHYLALGMHRWCLPDPKCMVYRGYTINQKKINIALKTWAKWMDFRFFRNFLCISLYSHRISFVKTPCLDLMKMCPKIRQKISIHFGSGRHHLCIPKAK